MQNTPITFMHGFFDLHTETGIKQMIQMTEAQLEHYKKCELDSIKYRMIENLIDDSLEFCLFKYSIDIDDNGEPVGISKCKIDFEDLDNKLNDSATIGK